MALEFFRRASCSPARLAVLPGTFNPPTLAHLALANAALGSADEVLFVLPRVFPHKPYEGASFEERVSMLEAAVAGESRFSIAAIDRGLFIEIAEEARAAYGPGVRLTFLCGRDAAERIVNWDYGRPGAIEQMLEVFDLLVASRQGDYAPPDHLRARISALELESGCDEVSATEVRRRMAAGEPWEHLVPPACVPLVCAVYSQA
jgi:nicotinate (nicotinamide) nucleotide adenylyltransferase